MRWSPNFRGIIRNVEDNKIHYEIFRVLSHFPHYISYYISENRLLLGQCVGHDGHLNWSVASQTDEMENTFNHLNPQKTFYFTQAINTRTYASFCEEKLQ